MRRVIKPAFNLDEHDHSFSSPQYESNCIEYWKPITDNEVWGIRLGKYWISTFGRIWSTASNQFIHPYFDKDGYYVVVLNGRYDTRKSIYLMVHRIVMLAFCYFPYCEWYEVNHKDGNKTNIMLNNLEWATPTDNKRHACRMGLRENTYGDKSNLATMTEEQAENVVRLYSEGHTVNEIYEMTNHVCSKCHMERLVKGICRRKLAEKYNLI